MSDATNAINMTPVSLPRYLARPAFRPLPTESIATAALELADTPLNYIRDGLQCLGPDPVWCQGRDRIQLLPKEPSVVVNDLSADMPTHMLAVYSRQVPAATKRGSSAPATPKSGVYLDPRCPSVHSCTRGFPFHLPLHQAHRPSPCNPAALTEDPTSQNVHTQLQQFATKLAALAPAHVLLARAMAVNGLWRNACALGIADEKLCISTA
ncbi:hypothetical protein SCLCIDRAFT_26460 [Scleroderma citrinum Foug A]|uniref:Uncharacterized protein n=1 Tax=Scleroderma citrinum Foug A TaxID=1036808 RepID=A0A0C3DIR6_9AGAM|nr:hypothetical protein SCLCIDRAFT_26460 [Scleroderma citrinum Foug A]